jgi:energy-coupling factor transport system ATP-binding protein
MAYFLELDSISFKYEGIGGSQGHVLKDVSLQLGKKECVALVGPSGSGKTTLIQHFTGLLKPTSGRVLFQDQDIWARRYKKTELRKKIGIVFQFPETQLFEETVEKDISFGPQNLGVPAEEIERRVRDAMQAVDLSDKFCSRSPFRLSEGEKRRAAIAGILAMHPEMLVFDEPTAGLDPQSVRRFSQIIRRLLDSRSIVIVTHNMDFVADIADRVIALHSGSLVFDGPPHELFRDAHRVAEIGLEMPTLSQILAKRLSTPEYLRDSISLQELEQKIENKSAQTHKV